MQWIYDAVERGRVPDPLVWFGIRRLLRQRLRQAEGGDVAAQIEHMRSAPIALNTADANQQNYELPATYGAGEAERWLHPWRHRAAGHPSSSILSLSANYL